jgi:hypothetical protein
MSEPIHILSLGAGVQSSTLALMASCGEVTPMPVAAIFADTQSEPQSVYRWLEWLTPKLNFPIHIVTAGNLELDVLKAIEKPHSRCGQPPFFVSNNDGDGHGKLLRKCTTEYKLIPIRRKVRELSGGKTVIQWIGISLDEAHRMKDSRVKYITNRYPLIERRMTRWDCLRWMKSHNYPQPPKSACWFCPFASDARWRLMKDTMPDEWEKATGFDDKLRVKHIPKLAAGIKGTLYLHRSCKPLRDVDLSTDTDEGQQELFGQECEGMCGV